MSSVANHLFPARVGGTLGCPLCASLDQKTISEHERKWLKRCLHCDASYVFPQPSLSTVTAHFEDSSTLSETDLESKFERNRERVLSRVADYIQNRKQEGSILDVGCATGFFLGRFFPKPKWHVWGVELSRQTAEKAAEKGIRVHCGSIRTAKFAESSFDIVSVIDTFYYFPEPQSELAQFHRVLKGDGMLMLELPLAGSRIWRTSGRLGKLLSGTRRPLLESSDHLFYYTPKSISLLLERCGFRVQAILPLPGNKQEHFFRNLIYRAYSFLSLVLHSASRSRILLGPRFLVAAGKELRQQHQLTVQD